MVEGVVSGALTKAGFAWHPFYLSLLSSNFFSNFATRSHATDRGAITPASASPPSTALHASMHPHNYASPGIMKKTYTI